MTTTAPARDVLTQDEAAARAAHVSNVRYEIALDLTRGAETYRGDTSIHFTFSGEGDTFLDFRGKRIDKFEVNGGDLDPALLWTGYRLTVPADALVPETPCVFSMRTSTTTPATASTSSSTPRTTGVPLHPLRAVRVAPRSSPASTSPTSRRASRSTVALPPTGCRRQRAEVSRGRRQRPPTRLRDHAAVQHLLFALIAGPYQAVREHAPRLGLGLFCRQSLAQHLDAEEIFTVHRAGPRLLRGVLRPRVPLREVRPGVRARVQRGRHGERRRRHLPERTVPRPVTDAEREPRRGRADEMAHMWFGDLVTMHWWNDLWLNESFATYMAYLAPSEHALHGCVAGVQLRHEVLGLPPGPAVYDPPDRRPGSRHRAHLPQLRRHHLRQGRSVIEQLVAAMGLDGFRNGMRIYFNRHAYGNTTLSQWLNASAKASAATCTMGTLWLETPSLNTIAASWDSRRPHSAGS